jgi:negative regulator of sigma-B (phosphoserine phosphatase)
LELSLFHVTLPKEGETLSGDAFITRRGKGTILLAVIDALGHGPHAAVVADRGREYLESVSLEISVADLTEGLHDALRGTRGAAAMLCLLRDGHIQGCGVGNVELRTLACRIPVVQSPGILGVTVRRARVFEASLVVGARLFLFSDGLSPRMDLVSCERLSAEQACKSLVDRYRRTHDDATLVVADVQTLKGPE